MEGQKRLVRSSTLLIAFVYTLFFIHTAHCAETNAPATPKLVKMSFFGAAGQSMGYTTYEYNSAGKIKKTSVFGATGVLSSYSTFEYTAKGDIAKTSNYIINNVLTAYTTYEYNSDRKMIKMSMYACAGGKSILSTYIMNIYDTQGNITKTSTYNGISKQLLHYSLYKYNSAGDQIKETNYALGLMTGYNTTTYDVKGREIRTSNYGPTGQLEEYATTQYNAAGFISVETTYNGYTKRKTEYSTYQYNASRKLTKTSNFDFADNLTDYTTISYNTDGTKKRLSVYDDTGLLKQYTTFQYAK